MEFNTDEYPIIELDTKGQLIATNEKFRQSIGLDSDSIDPPTIDFIDDSKNSSLPLRAVFKSNRDKHHCLLQPVSTGGDRLAYIFSVIPTPSDIQSKGLQEQINKLEISNKGLKDFALIAAHDLNEPFRTIENFLSLYKETLDNSLSEEAQLYLDMVEMAAGRMRALLSGILQYYKTEETQKENISIGTLLDEIENDLKLQIESSKSEIVRKNIIDVHGDRNMTYLLFKNLISNAIKFGPKKESPKIEINSTLIDGFVEYSIKDNGMGISEENHEAVFNMFKRLNPKGEYEGAGIGLALCKNIVEGLGGKIRVESNESQGSIFIFTMPLSIN